LYIHQFVHLVNLSLSEGIFPDELKLARVAPIYKSGDPKLINNYRPISVLPFFSKIFEKIIYSRLITFINKHNLIYRYQFGFRHQYSTLLALVTLVDRIITGISNSEITLGTCLDFSKAFDTVDHKILLKKLEVYGIRGIAHKLIKSYLDNRKQYVIFNSCSSTLKTINCGVPQGSIIGPLLFILYINDMAYVSDKVFPIFYADDSNLFVKGINVENMVNVLNCELSKIYDWLNANKLSLNLNKTQCIIFKSRKKKINNTFTVKIDNTIVNYVSFIKFLGVTIDSHLSWEHHSKHIRKKISKGLGILCKAKKYLKKDTLKTLYYSFVYPYLNYAIEIWGNLKASEMYSIKKLQKRALRIVAGVPYRTPTLPLFQSMKIMNVKEVYTFKVALFMYKVNRNEYPHIVCDMFQSNVSIHQYNTRQRSQYHVPICHDNISQNNIRYKGVLIWNTITTSIDYHCSYHTFKKHVRNFILQNNRFF
jgi:hypothetical protein